MESSTKRSPNPTVQEQQLFLPSCPQKHSASSMVLIFLFLVCCICLVSYMYPRLPPQSGYEYIEGRESTTLKTQPRLWSDTKKELSFDGEMSKWMNEWINEWWMEAALLIAQRYSLVYFLFLIMARQWRSLTRRTSYFQIMKPVF